VGGAVALSLLVSACSTNSNNAGKNTTQGTTDASSDSASSASSSPSASADNSASTTPKPTPKPVPPAPRLSVLPASGATDVRPAIAAKVTVAHGTLRDVSLLSSSGAHIKLRVSADKRTVTTAQELGYDRTYTWSGRAVGAEGRTVRVAGAFHTVAPATVLHASVNIGDGSRVGVGAPIIITFGGHVTDRAAAEKALTVRTSVPTIGSWAWLPDDGGQSRVHWRPERYWKAGTKVGVSAKFFGVSYGGGVYGEEDVTSHFSIGRAQITKADVRSYRLVIYRDGKKLFDFPASYGLASDPNRNTHSGVHIVMEKFPVKYMTNLAYGYKNLPEKWAVRISNNGEFIHENDGTDGVQGSANVTHGCVNLNETNALAYYKSVLYGDPVEVTGSPIKLSASDGDNYDWTVPWATWKTMSALG
jgi:lipoprotein-anchoring transpeptidase ErfK/SrfK